VETGRGYLEDTLTVPGLSSSHGLRASAAITSGKRQQNTASAAEIHQQLSRLQIDGIEDGRHAGLGGGYIKRPLSPGQNQGDAHL